jgi:hypothetical protein
LAGRPKRDLAEQRELLCFETLWHIVIAQLRYGIENGNDDERQRVQHYRRLGYNLDQITSPELMQDPPANDLPAEPKVWKALTDLGTKPAEVRRLWAKSKYLKGFYIPAPAAPDFPAFISWGTAKHPVLGDVLYKHAEKFCKSKRDTRYPRAGLRKGIQQRQSSEDKRHDYLARVLAGLSLQRPLAPATADSVLRSIHRKIKHTKRCPCLHCVSDRQPTASG